MALTTFIVAACAPSLAHVQSLVAFIEDGKTTREELRGRLGSPSREYEEGRIWTYQGPWWLPLDPKREKWQGEEVQLFHLVVVFGDRDVVKTYSVVRLR